MRGVATSQKPVQQRGAGTAANKASSLAGHDELSDPKTSMMTADAAACTRNRFPKATAASASSPITKIPVIVTRTR